MMFPASIEIKSSEFRVPHSRVLRVRVLTLSRAGGRPLVPGQDGGAASLWVFKGADFFSCADPAFH